MQRHTLLGLLILATAGSLATAQEETPPPKPDKDPAPPLHRPVSRLNPADILRHLQRGNAAWNLAFGDDQRAPKPLARPAGSGSFVATVVHTPDLRYRPDQLLATGPRDLFCVSSPGPVVRPAEVGMIELLDSADVCLCVILVNEDSLGLRLRDPKSIQGSPGLRHLQRHARHAETVAKQDGIHRALAHGRLQRLAILNGSPKLSRAAKAHRFGIAVGIVDPRTGSIEWDAPDLGGWPVLLDAKGVKPKKSGAKAIPATPAAGKRQP